jgi:magnesium-transporting ATPase (P-type)
VIPFNSSRKRACTAIRVPQQPNKVRVYCKGGPEVVLQYVTNTFDSQGNAVELNKSKKEEIMAKVVTKTFAEKAYRTLLIAYREYTFEEYQRLEVANNGFASEADREVLEKDLTLIGIYALQDPLRDEIIESVKICHRAGVNVRMVTGDNLDTAKAIALEAGILDHNACMDGKTFREACGGLRKIDTGNDLLREEIVNKDVFRLIAKRL